MKRRTLKDEERKLWEEVKRTVDPLRRAPPPPVPPPAPPPPAVVAAANTERPAAPSARSAPQRTTPRGPAGLDDQTRRKIARGRVAIDARIDLHGMTQDEAHAALLDFIARSAAMRRRVVLVITGKGDRGDGRGVLRRSVPHWLTTRDVANAIVGFGPAHPSHGGDGAIYVRLRVRRR